MLNDVATLIYKTISDNKGFDVEETERYDVYVNVKSVSRNEFYKALSTGIAPSIVFEMRKEDYNLTKHIVNGKAVYASEVEYDGATYKIIREYQINKSFTEVTCE